MQNTIKELYLLQKKNFQSGKTQELAFKKQALKTLKSVIKKYENEVLASF